MKTLCLYTGSLGNPLRCLIQHDVAIDQYDLSSGLPDISHDGNLFIIRDQPDDFAPLVESNDEAVHCHYIMLADKPDAQS